MTTHKIMKETKDEPKVEIVDETERCCKVVSILSHEPVLAVDCLGVQLASRGPLTLIQVGTYSDQVYLFDVHKNEKLLVDGKLGTLLESEAVIKVMYKCSSDSAALFYQHNIILRNVFDVKVAHILLEEQKGRLLIPFSTLRTMCKLYSTCDRVSEYKEEIQTQCDKKVGDFWAKRPLTDKMISYAIGNVSALIPEVYENQKRLLKKSELDLKFKDRVMETICVHMDPEQMTLRTKQREERIQEIINSIDENGNADTKITDFGEESDEMLAFRRLHIKDAQRKSDFIDRLKTESIEYDLKKIGDKIKEEKSNFVPEIFTFKFLSETQSHHHDENIIQQATQLKYQIKEIVFADIETKYSMETSLQYLTHWEKDALRNMNANRICESPKVRRRLFFLLTEADVDRKIKQLHKYGNNYRCNEKFYSKIKFIATNASDVPESLRQKARDFVRQHDALDNSNQTR